MTTSSIKPTKTQTAESLAHLRETIRPGDVVEVIQRHVSSSGMMRYLSLRHNGQDITFHAGRAMGDRVYEYHGQRALKVTGCGMDMHFHTVYNLAMFLFPELPIRDRGYALTHRTI